MDPQISSRILPEYKLLLALCRVDPSDAQKEEIKDYVKDISNWDLFIRSAGEHGLIALCYFNLAQIIKNGLIPAESAERMYHGYIASLSRNTLIYRQLEYLYKITKEASIKLILIKGLALEKSVYGDRGLRQMNDLDILVKENDAIKLRKLLLCNGFDSIPIISPLHERILPSYGKHLPEMYKDGLSVEIHFKLFDEKGNSHTEELIQRSSYRDPENKFLIPDTLFHFLYLVKHLAKHEAGGSSQLRLYADLIALTTQYRKHIINDLLLQTSGELKLEQVMLEKLFILNYFWNIELPENLMVRMTSSERVRIIETFLGHLTAPFRQDLQKPQNEASLLKPMHEMDLMKDKVFFFLGYLFPSLAFMKYRYGARSKITGMAFYPVRWAKLLKLLKTETIR